jgi:hypothetical protein
MYRVGVETWRNRLNCVLARDPGQRMSDYIREQTVNTSLYGRWQSYILAQAAALGDEVKHIIPHILSPDVTFHTENLDSCMVYRIFIHHN